MIDIISYLLGKNSVVIPEPPAPEPPKLQDKALTITENKTTNIQADEGYDGLQLVTVETNVQGGNAWLSGDMTDVNYAGIQLIKKVDVSGLHLTSANKLFSSFINLEKVEGTLDLTNVTVMDDCFNSCRKLTGPDDFPQMNTSNVVKMSSSFASCNTLVTLPTLDMGRVERAYRLCGNCPLLENVPVMNLVSLRDMYSNQMFYNCPSLTNESLNNIMASYLTVGSGWGSGYKTLKTIGLSQDQATTCTTLSNWAALSAAGWTTGY